MRLWASFHKEFPYLNSAGWICFHLQTAWNMTTTADGDEEENEESILINSALFLFPGNHFSTSALLIETEFVWFSFKLIFVSFSNFFFSARRQRCASELIDMYECSIQSVVYTALNSIIIQNPSLATLSCVKTVDNERAAIYPKWPKQHVEWAVPLQPTQNSSVFTPSRDSEALHQAYFRPEAL